MVNSLFPKISVNSKMSNEQSMVAVTKQTRFGKFISFQKNKMNLPVQLGVLTSVAVGLLFFMNKKSKQFEKPEED